MDKENILVNKDPKIRLNDIIDVAWKIFFQRVLNNRQKINQESSMQLHLSQILHELGELCCILPNERFDIVMESKYEKKYIDIVCILGEVKAAIELKCFIKSSNRATDIDMYYVLEDIQRLENYSGFDIRTFICLTNNGYYPLTTQTGLGKSVSLKQGNIFKANTEIIPDWAGKWKVRAEPIVFKKDIVCNWHISDLWYYLKLDV